MFINNNFINSKIINNPFPHIILENFLDIKLAKKIQNDILNIDDKMFDSFDLSSVVATLVSSLLSCRHN